MDLRSSRLHQYETGDDILLYDDVVSHYDESQAYISDESFVPGSEHYVTPEYADGEFQERRMILADGGDRFGVTSVAFDSQEELLWMGNGGGHVTSYYSSELQKYTSFQIHATEDVRCLHTFDSGVLALTPSSLRCQMRRGIPMFTHSSDNMIQMQCLLQTSPQTLLLGGHTHKLIEFDLSTYQEVNLLDAGENGCAILRQHNRFICCGDPSGRIELRAPNTLRVEHSLEAHTGSLSDFDLHGNLLVTCGFSNRQGGLAVDRFLMVYDLRMMRAVNPIPLLLDPLLLRFMPSMSSRIAVASSMGQLQLVDTVPLSEPDLTVYQVNSTNSMVISLDVSSSCQALAVGDSGGSIHLFSSHDNSIFNNFSTPTEFADPIESFEPISITDSLAILSSIPLIYTNPPTTMLSDWPKEFLRSVYRPTPPIDPEILRTMKMQGTIGYAPNPNTRLRNQVPYNSQNGVSSKEHNKNEETSPVFAAIPKRYRKLDLRYPKMDDGEMEQYNKTGFSGLEANLPNSYCNAMIQVLYFLEPLRHVILSHLCHSEFCLSCELGFLFRMLDVSRGAPCHAGNFLRALRNAHEAAALGLILPDHASNKKTNLIGLIQNWNRFILHQIHFELLEETKRREKENAKSPPFVYRDTDFPSIDIQRQKRKTRPDVNDEAPVSSNVESKEEESQISRMFGTKQIHIHRCLKCLREVSKESSLLVCNLIYPENDLCRPVQFCEVLSQSLCPQQTTPAWCDQCERFQQTEQSRRIKSLPSLLTVNCGMDNNQEKSFWQTQMDILVKKAVDVGGSPAGKPCRYGTACTRPGCRFKHPDQRTGGVSASPSPSHLYQSNSWLPHHIQVDLRANGQVNITKLDRPDEPIINDKETYIQSEIYDLCAVVCHINEERKNLVGLINVGPGYHQRASGSNVSQWYVFNDFSITPVTSQEAVWFSLDWKVPCVLYWTNHAAMSQVLPTPNLDLPVDILAAETCLATSGRGITFTPLSAEEAPGSGDLVAMDAEFVTLNQEESELRSDGKTATVKPSHKSVARISCIRGQGSQKGVPFIDDYISTQEQVVDYLTKFSGIKPGDLDANYSNKHLTTLKSTYLKLRYLVDNGVIFVGHGLRNDFRVINLVVPQEQVKDTVHLFHLPHQRMVSLRFLTWHFLDKKIQSESHDSIEDARAALELYEKYKELEQKNIVRETLEAMYKEGIASQWRVPEHARSLDV